MAEDNSYFDRALTEANEYALPKPQIEIIVAGNSVFKPSMKTYFVDDYNQSSGKFDSVIMGEYCSCDTVITTHLVCTCEAVCSCVSHTVCTCDEVCTCENVCSCDTNTVCSCDEVCTCEDVCNCDGYSSPSSGGGQWVSCGSPCACVPVH